jgi:hypothetical protein
MVLVQSLAVVNAADEVRKVELDDADGRLQEEDDVRDEPEDRVRRLEVRACVPLVSRLCGKAWEGVRTLVVELVDDDDDERVQERRGRAVENRVRDRTGPLLLGRVRRLQDERALQQDCNPNHVQNL